MGIKKKLLKYKSYIINLLVPSIVFGFVTGTITSIIVMMYKLCAKHIIELSSQMYDYLKTHLYFVPIFVVSAVIISILLSYIYKRTPNIKGGGIPTSVGILRGIITFKWLKNLVGVFTLSLLSFLMGVPVGNEGPSVQMGTAIGRGSVYTFAKKHRAWDRYSMTGGACAGFSVATGAPISGILFAIEEAHQRISPTIIIVSSSSVLFANITSSLLSPIFGVNEKLFELPSLPTLSVTQYWIPLLVGLAVGIFSVLFLYYYRIIDDFLENKLKNIPYFSKILGILLLTMVLGLVSFSFISTGHDLVDEILKNKEASLILLVILLVRTTMTLGANSVGITGGTFIPILSLGALVASLIGEGLLALGINGELYTIIVILGISACISGSMKMPLTAIIFSVEALSCHANIIPVVIAVFIAYLVTELFGVKSINDTVIELRTEDEEDKGERIVVDTYVTVQKGAFAVGKQIRDIFWPSNLFVLSLKRSDSGTRVDEHGGKELKEGDILHVRYTTTDEIITEAELIAIVGEQEIRNSIAERL